MRRQIQRFTNKENTMDTKVQCRKITEIPAIIGNSRVISMESKRNKLSNPIRHKLD